MASKSDSTALHALLIGIDHYWEYRLPGGIYYPQLYGCVRDIMRVRSFLTARLALDPANITLLSATIGGAQPRESEEVWPTYPNMVRAFRELQQRVEPGDQAYIHYAGHGGRTLTQFPDLKGSDGFDEGLVPLDIGRPNDPNARYLRDVEMHSLIQDLVDKEIRLTVVLDCCHSGGATRDIGGARKRGISQPDLSPPPAESGVGDASLLAARWRINNAAATRGPGEEYSWLFEPKGYTLLAACRANESSFEFPFDGNESNGALTYWMLDTLVRAGPNTTWQMVADRVANKVHGQFAEQMPMLQGEGDFRVFGASRLATRYGVGVLACEPETQRVRIQAGEAHGLATGTYFEVFATMADVDDPHKRQALIEVDQVGATDSWATVVEPEGEMTVEIGSQAVMLNATSVRLQRTVRVVIGDRSLREQVESAITTEGRGFVAVADTSAGADFLVDRHPERSAEFVIQDSGGAELPFLRPALLVADEDAIATLVQRLIHLAQYRNIQTLDMPDAAMTPKLDVAYYAKTVNRPGDTIKLEIRNVQDINPDNPDDPDRVLNVTILALSSDWSVAQIYPSQAGQFEPVDPGSRITLAFEAYLPDGRDSSQDLIKIFATRTPTSFRWLELPPLDQPRRQPSTRAVITDPIEQMLAMVTAEKTTTRELRLKSDHPRVRDWTVAHVEIRVER